MDLEQWTNYLKHLLIQCQKVKQFNCFIRKRFLGKCNWLNKFVEAGTISKGDLNLFKIVDDVETAKAF